MTRHSVSLALAAVCMSMLQAPAALAGGDPIEWLERMSTAMSQMDYQGTFVYVQGDRMDTMRLTHVAGENGVQERLVSLTGSPREVLRDANGVRWAFGDGQAVLSDSGFKQTLFPELPVDRAEALSRSYAFHFGKPTQVAGHEAVRLNVLPRDHYRYGYALWLESRTGLLLKWELVDSSRKPQARLMFTDLRFGAEVDRDELRPGQAMKSYRNIDSELPAATRGAGGLPHWAPDRLPPGFSLTTYRHHPGDEGGSAFEHLVYGDGLAALSVYVESAGDEPSRPGFTQKKGTMHAYTGCQDGVIVTVVGNVPAPTVELVGRSVQRVSR
jgi:sigma-E factor negative regulatory protein RseB